MDYVMAIPVFTPRSGVKIHVSDTEMHSAHGSVGEAFLQTAQTHQGSQPC